jgi:hypothetical protein
MLMIVLMVIGALLLLTMIGFGTFWVLVQIGVIAQKAMEPPASDTSGAYSLDQGRDVGNSSDRP